MFTFAAIPDRQETHLKKFSIFTHNNLMNISKFSLISKLFCNVLSEDPFMYFIEEVSLDKED